MKLPLPDDEIPRLPIIPGGKRPAVSGWQKLPPGYRPDNLSQLDAYGILTGRGFFVLDVDHANGEKVGHASLQALEEKYGDLPETYTVRTPTGGLHLYFRGDARTGTNTPGQDLDIRGDGGQVLGPGSKHPQGGTYDIENDSPVAEAPDWLLAVCRTSQTQAADRAPYGVVKTLEDLKQITGKKRAHSALFWRDVAKGVLPSTLPASGWNDHLTAVTHWLANQEPDWCEVSGEMVAGLMGPSLSHMHAYRIERGQDLQHIRAPDVASMYDRAAAKVRTGRAADRALADNLERAKNDTTSPPKILQHRNTYYLAKDGGFSGPYIKDQLWAAARDMQIEGMEVHRPTQKGLVRMSPDDLVELYGRGGSIENLVTDLTIQKAHIKDLTLFMPANVRPTVHPRFCPDIDTWLQMIGGDVLCDWISTAKDLDHACPALWISGTPGIGKTLIVRGLAQLFGSAAPTPMEKAMGQYNALLAKCPIVDGQEKIPTTWRGAPRLDDLKSLITDTERTIQEKYIPNSTLRGALRVVMSSNNLDMLQGARDITTEDAQALQERIVHLHYTEQKAARYLDKISVQTEWIDSGRLAQHFQHLIETRNPAFGKRLRLPPHDYQDTLELTLATQPGKAFWVLKALYEWMTIASKASELPQDTRLTWDAETQALNVTSTSLQRRMDHPHSVRHIGSTLRRLSKGNRKTTAFPDGAVRRAWVVPLDIMVHWAETSGWSSKEEMLDMVKKLDRLCADGQ